MLCVGDVTASVLSLLSCMILVFGVLVWLGGRLFQSTIVHWKNVFLPNFTFLIFDEGFDTRFYYGALDEDSRYCSETKKFFS